MRNERTDKRMAETKRQQIVSLGNTPTSSASHRPALRNVETLATRVHGRTRFLRGRLVGTLPSHGPSARSTARTHGRA